MVKVGIILVALLSCTYTVPVYAVVPDGDSAVSKTFKQIGRTMRGMRDASNSEELLVVLNKIRALAVENSANVPSFMQDDQALLTEYQEGMVDLIARVDAAIAAAEGGDFDGAMELMKNVRGAKQEYHDKFEMEESD